MERVILAHVPFGLLLLIGAACLAVSVLLLIEASVIRPAARAGRLEHDSKV
jgi:hypothetical protein